MISQRILGFFFSLFLCREAISTSKAKPGHPQLGFDVGEHLPFIESLCGSELLTQGAKNLKGCITQERGYE